MYNEPIVSLGGETWDGDVNRATTTDWNCWRNGCVIPGPVSTYAVGYKTAGMQQLLSTLRAAGATQPVMLGPPSFAQDFSQWVNYLPTDETPAGWPAGQTWLPQIIASYHRYGVCANGQNTPCPSDIEKQIKGDPNAIPPTPGDRAAEWSYLATIAMAYPVVAGEFGEYDCGTSYSYTFMNFADQYGINYLGWSFNNFANCGNPTLLVRTAGTFQDYYDANPTAAGVALQFRLSALVTTPATVVDTPLSASVVGQPVTFTATVTTPNPATPTGTVTFKDGVATLGTGTLSGGLATLQTSALTVGNHSLIHAVYGGDANFVTSTSSDVKQTVTRGTTTTAAGAAPNPSKFGQSVTFTATVMATAPASGTPTGTVTFKNGATTLGTGILSAGTATFATSALTVGNHPGIHAIYGGDAGFAISTVSGVTQTVTKGATTTTASAAPTTVAPGAAVTLKAQVNVTAPASATPAGQVTFKDKGVTLGVGTVASGVAQLTVNPMSIGSHTGTAIYSGDSELAASSATVGFTVSAAVGPQTRINTTVAGSQQTPAVAALKSGYVVAWASNGQDGSGFGIYAQRYTAAGAKAGGELAVNTVTAGDQIRPAVAGLSNGGFVAVWQSKGEDGSGFGIYGQRYTAAGARAGTAFKVNSTTAGDQTLPAVAVLSGGGFAVAWTSNGQDGAGLGVYAQIYSAGGLATGGAFKVNTTTAGDQSSPTIAALTGGGFVIAWQSGAQDGSGLGVYARRYDATGKAQSGELKVNTVTVNDQSLPSIAALDNGGFVIAWQSALQDGSGLGVYAQRYGATGIRVAGETRVNTTTLDDQATPRAAGFSDGGYVIVWASKNQDGSGEGVYAQAFNDAGASVNVEFRVNTTTALDQYQPAAAAFASGSFIAVWTSQSSDGSLENVFAQRFLLPGTH